jgi:hypothetical protein
LGTNHLMRPVHQLRKQFLDRHQARH